MTKIDTATLRKLAEPHAPRHLMNTRAKALLSAADEIDRLVAEREHLLDMIEELKAKLDDATRVMR